MDNIRDVGIYENIIQYFSNNNTNINSYFLFNNTDIMFNNDYKRKRYNVLLLGSGGREHAIAKALKKSNKLNKLYVISTNKVNPGLTKLAHEIYCMKLYAPVYICQYIASRKINIIVFGSENLLAQGFANLISNMTQKPVNIIGPMCEFAQIESSKVFARNLMKKYDLDKYSPAFKYFNPDYDTTEVEQYINTLQNDYSGYVIKYNTLYGGKGVKVSGDHINDLNEALEFCNKIKLGELNKKTGFKYIRSMVHGFSCPKGFLIEQKLIGEEFSLLSFCDGKTLKHMPLVKDFKRAYNNDKGPNTGGMGSISYSNGSMPFLTPSDVQTAKMISERIIEALQHEVELKFFNIDKSKNPDITFYCGFLYSSFMKTEDGIKVIEFNCRMGDSEAINIFELLDTDLIDIFNAMGEQKLDTIDIKFKPLASVCKYLVPNGYPDNSEKDFVIDISNVVNTDRLIYASCYKNGKNDKVYYRNRIVYNNDNNDNNNDIIGLGSRTIAVVANGLTLAEANNKVEETITKISGNMFYRNDIGTDYKSNNQVNQSNQITYQDAGVNVNTNTNVVNSIKEHVVSTYNNRVVGQYGSFGGCYSLNSNTVYPILVSSMDGVGTKSILVIERYGLEGYRMLGHDLVNHSVNDILVQGATPMFFLDYFASSSLTTEQVTYFVQGLSEACRETNCVLIGGETAEMPDVYTRGHCDLVGTIVGQIETSYQLIDPKVNIKRGNIVIALPSVSPHTNGYSLIRKIIENEKNNNRDIPSNHYQKLCTSHKCYLKEINMIRQEDITINGLCHITGGGLIENPPRILPDGLTINWHERVLSEMMPDYFSYLQEIGNISQTEMRRTFNCGIGMLVVVKPKYVIYVLDLITNSRVVGTIEPVE